MPKVRIIELSEPMRGNNRFIVETKTKESIVAILWGLFMIKRFDWEIPKSGPISVEFANYSEAEVAARRWQDLVTPKYHYLQ